MKKQISHNVEEVIETSPEIIEKVINETWPKEISVRGTEQECERRLSDIRKDYSTEIIGVVNIGGLMRYDILITKE